MRSTSMTFAFVLLVSICSMAPVEAEMLIGAVQYHEVEGRIGVLTDHSGKVFKVHCESPADTAGILPDDRIFKVDGKENNVEHIKGTPGTMVRLTIVRGQARFSIDVPRADYRTIRRVTIAGDRDTALRH